MNFLKQYIKIINYVLMGLVFGFACFYLLTNAYHYLEIRKDFVVDLSKQPLIVDLDDNIATINKNISSFNPNTYSGNIPTNKMTVIYQGLKGCVNIFNTESLQQLKNKDRVTIIDVYNLREDYENEVLSDCIVTNLYWTTTVDQTTFNSTYLVNNKDMMKLYVDSLLDTTSYLKKDLLNNSSYYFNTNIASSSIKDNIRDGFYEVMGAYNKASEFVLFVSEWFKDEVEGNYD